MKLIFLFILNLVFVSSLFSQEVKIEASFLNDGDLLDKPLGQRFTKFKRDQKCYVLEYLGRHHFKVEYKKWVGYVMYEDLDITEEIRTLIKEHESLEKKNEEIVKAKQDSIQLEEERKYQREREERLIKRRQRDSLETSQKTQEDSIAKLNIRNKCAYSEYETDEFTKQKRIATDYYTIKETFNNKYYFMIKLKKVGFNEYVYFALDEDLGCASPYKTNRSYVKVKLENEDILTFFHAGDVNCGEFELIGKLSNSEKSRLNKSPIKTIRLEGTKYYRDITNLNYKEFFIDKIKCIE